MPVRIEDKDGVVLRAFHDQAEPRFAFLQLLLGLLLFGDIVQDHDAPSNRPHRGRAVTLIVRSVESFWRTMIGTLSTEWPFTARHEGNSCGGNGVLVSARSRWSAGDQRRRVLVARPDAQ